MAAKKPAAKKPAPKAAEVIDEVQTLPAVRSPQGGAVATVSDRLKQYAARMREEVAKAPASNANMLSFKGGKMTLGEQPLGNSIPVVVLGAQFERAYYPGQYVPGEAVVPSCYSRDAGDDAAPHPASAFPQSPKCKTCQWNEFESAREGKGKACKEGLKLALVHADNVAGGKAEVAQPPLIQARLSVMNAKQVRQDLLAIGSQPGLDHTIQAICELTCVDDARTQYKAGLRFAGFAPGEVVEQLEPLIDPAMQAMNEPYPASMAIDPKAAAAKPSKARSVRNY